MKSIILWGKRTLLFGQEHHVNYGKHYRAFEKYDHFNYKVLLFGQEDHDNYKKYHRALDARTTLIMKIITQNMYAPVASTDNQLVAIKKLLTMVLNV